MRLLNNLTCDDLYTRFEFACYAYLHTWMDYTDVHFVIRLPCSGNCQSVVVLNEDTSNPLFFYSRLFSRSKFGCPIGRCSRLAPYVHSWCILVFKSTDHAHFLENGTFGSRHQLHCIICHAEIKDPKSQMITLIGRRLHDTAYD